MHSPQKIILDFADPVTVAPTYLEGCERVLRDMKLNAGRLVVPDGFYGELEEHVACELSEIHDRKLLYYSGGGRWGLELASINNSETHVVVRGNKTVSLHSTMDEVIDGLFSDDHSSQTFNLELPEFLCDYVYLLREVNESDLQTDKKRQFNANEVFDTAIVNVGMHASACDISFFPGGCAPVSKLRYQVCQDKAGPERENECLWFLRVKKSFSAWWAWNYLENTSEGQGLLDRLRSPGAWKWKEVLRDTTIVAPRSRAGQVLDVLELSSLRAKFMRQVHEIMYKPKPMSAQKEFLARQVDVAKTSLDTHVAEVERLVSPLPVVFEHPLHCFHVSMASADMHKAAVAAQNLLNALCKIPLFVVLEEGGTATPLQVEVAEVSRELHDRPASDGTLLGWQKKLLGLCANSGMHFSRRMRDIMSAAVVLGLERCVRARNTYHHPPYDLEGFIGEMQDFLAAHESPMRKAFSDLWFVKVRNLHVSDGDLVCTFLKLEGSTPWFPSTEIKTSLDARCFGSESVILYDAADDKSLTFKTYLAAEEQARQAVNVRVFNRPAADGGEFEYVFTD